MSYQQGDIIKVQYPFSDKLGETKLRPAIVISNDKSNALDHDFLICPITTQIRQSPFSFLIDDSDLVTPLPKNSEVRCNKITTIRDSLILSKISELKSAPLAKLLVKVKSSIDHFPVARLVDPK